MARTIFVLSLRVCFVVLATSFFVVSSVRAAPPSIEAFFGKSPYLNATLSPNGRFIAVIGVYNGRYNASVVDLDTRKATAITNLDHGDVTRIIWQNDNRMIVAISDLHRGAGEPPKEFGYVAVNRDGSDVRHIERSFQQARGIDSIAFERGWRLAIEAVVPDSNEILIAADDRSHYSMDLYRFDTLNGKKTLLTFDSPGNADDWLTDFDGVPRAVVTDDLDNDKSAIYVRKSADAPWRKLEEAGLGRLKSRPVEFSPDGKILYMESRRDGDRYALYEYDIDADRWTGPIIKHAERDVAGRFVEDRKARKLYGFRYVDDKPSTVWFDAEHAKIQKSVDAALPDTVNRIQKRGDRWLVVASSDRDPGEVYLLDSKSMQLEKVLSNRPAIDPQDIAPTTWVRYPARDGLMIPALLTVPKGAQGKRVPLIVEIHGGPNVPATTSGFDNFYADVPFFASRGYAVLQPQFRGTQGFGWKFESAGFHRWGDEMQDDLADGVKWAVDQGIADPDRVCFYGASYGGYAAMWGAIKNADIIKCAVAFVGVSSIDFMFDKAETDMARLAEKSTLMKDMIGDPKTDRERFRRVNPVDNADRVGVPILLAYGAADVRVPLVHGTAFRAALDKYHKPYEWVVYDGEAHGFYRDDHIFDFFHRVENFLAKYLGPGQAPAKAK